MANVWDIDDDSLQWIRDGLDDFLTNLGKNCTIVYPGKWESCTNCNYDAIGKKSANRWRSGGPMPFPNGSICPLCNGVGGRRFEEQTETVRLLVVFEPHKFFYPIENLEVTVPFSVCQTKGYVSDLVKLQKADRIVIETPLSPFVKLTYRRDGEPLDIHNIVQGRYCVITWRRAE